MMWVDDDTPSATVWTLKQYDGADWLEIGRLDVTNNIFIPSPGVIALTDVASAATTDIGASASPNVRITGTATITGLGTAPAGTRRFLTFAAVLTITYNATSLITPGLANITTAAGDNAVARSLGSGSWVLESYQASTQAGMRLLAGASPLPIAGAGVGNFTGIGPGVGAAAVLPAGGTWAWFIIRISATGTIASWSASVAAGGATIGGAVGGEQYLGFCWRIS
jgi:hypothetical protein